MKKIVRTAAMIALMFVTTTSIANEEKLSLVTKTDAKSLIYELDSTSGATKIELIDADNNVIYFENIENVSYTKKFDLKNLKDGLYYFTTEDAMKTIIYTINIAGADVKITKRKENSKPVFRKENGKVYLNLLNLSKKEVEIEVYDSSNRLLFSEKHVNEMIIEKAFNFTKAYEDSYTVLVRDSNNTYFEDIVVK